eukprot:TRINITY_DN9812_c1_g1_i1.p1 TRINITY_DN9812_c1_g1~~TRINITY_DN9812_c1_g1_i1.p1  ORF type:complete len:387 (+),score=53.94 TRINITY_DN9812_c1_g1_i1:273-1433(+)
MHWIAKTLFDYRPATLIAEATTFITTNWSEGNRFSKKELLPFTSSVARFLDRFLFKDNEVASGMVLHQCSADTDEKYIPDIKIFHRQELPLLVGDGKNATLDAACRQTAAYSICAGPGVYLALPFTRDYIALELHIVDKAVGVIIIRINTVNLTAVERFAGLLVQLKHGLLLLDSSNRAPAPWPIRQDGPCAHLQGNAYKCQDKIVKFFFAREHRRRPNLEAIQLAGPRGAELLDLDGLGILQYPFQPILQQPVVTVANFIDLAEKLQKLHEQGYVHADLRLANILFHDQTTTLIDFDLTRKLGEFYPEEYNLTISDGCRHPEALPVVGQVKLEHDLFSFFWLLGRYESRSDRWQQARAHDNLQAFIDTTIEIRNEQLEPTRKRQR